MKTKKQPKTLRWLAAIRHIKFRLRRSQRMLHWANSSESATSRSALAFRLPFCQATQPRALAWLATWARARACSAIQVCIDRTARAAKLRQQESCVGNRSHWLAAKFLWPLRKGAIAGRSVDALCLVLDM